ncbi:hypothetical protein Tco_0739473 [Tanacetum coccineum]
MEDGIFFNQSKYIKEMLKKFSLEDSKPMKTPMSSDTYTQRKDEECESVDSTKYRGMIGSELGIELTLLAASDLKTSELDSSELKTSEYRVRQNIGQGNKCTGFYKAGASLVSWGAQNRVRPNQQRNCTQPKRPQNSKYFKDKMLLMQAQENGVALDEKQLLFIASGQDNAIDEDVDEQPNMIPYDQYVKDNAVSVVQSNVSSVPNDAYMMIFNDMHEPHAQSVFDTTRNTVVDNSLTAELATYKEQDELYERRARFKLTEREQKIDKQLKIVITDRNIKEVNLKKELHSKKIQLASTINHNKSMVE